MNNPLPPVLGVVQRGLCCGCGVCAGVCPAEALEMRLGGEGQWLPTAVRECRSCGLCARVCPFYGERPSILARFLQNPDEGDLGEGGELAAWVGWAANHTLRWRASSGGLATLALLHLMRGGEIDCAVVAAPTLRASHPLFSAIVASDSDAIAAAAGSKYYPVEFSAAVKRLAKERARAAVVGLPCVCRAVRTAVEAVPRLRGSVRFLLGLTCGHLATTLFTDVLVATSGVRLGEGDAVEYRRKAAGRAANNFSFAVMRNGGPVGREVPMANGIFGVMWWARAFVPRACDFCPDVFAECADATFMDAWLPQYSAKAAGTSLVVTRNSAARSLLEGLAVKGEAELAPARQEDVVASQHGAVKFKRRWLRWRAAFLARRGVAAPAALLDGDSRLPAKLVARLAHFERNRRFSLAAWHSRLPLGLRLRLLRIVLELGLTGPPRVTWRVLRDRVKRRRRTALSGAGRVGK